MALYMVNPKADILNKTAALAANCAAAMGLQEVVKSNLGPRGTLKMLVGGAGQVKLTKDGSVLLHEMQIQHPTASMIARASTAQDSISGDGTTSNVLLVGELMKQCERHVSEGVHPTLLAEGIDMARLETLEVLDKLKVTLTGDPFPSREILYSVADTSLRTKLNSSLVYPLKDAVVEGVLLIAKKNEPIDLFMVETMHMKHKLATETTLVKGMVMDHGCRHPDMPRSLKKCYIFTCNISLEYEKSEVNSGFFYSSAEQRDKLVEAERDFTDAKVKKIIEFKREVCTTENGKSFVIFNQKGIDPPSLDMLAKEGIMALRRVKRRNMERLTLCCGGNALNSIDGMSIEDLGFADTVYEQMLGEDKFTFVEGVKNPLSCCILIKGPNDHVISQIKDAIRDGLRAVKSCIEDMAVVPGAGAFQIAAYCHLQEFKKTVSGKRKYGVEAFADALLVIPKTLACNSGFDAQDCLLNLIESYEKNKEPIGLDLMTGKPMSPMLAGIYDNYRVIRQIMSIAPSLAQHLLLVDEIIKAGKSMGGGGR